MSRLKEFWPWLSEARHTWLAVGVIAIALAVTLRPGTPECVIRLTGLILQLLGIGTVIWGISETRALFGHPSFAAKTKAWISRCPLVRRDIVISTLAGTLAAASCKGGGYTTQVPGPNATITTRVDALEKNVILIHERISSNETKADEEVRKAAEALKKEEQTRQTEDSLIREKLEATGTGGVHISAIGASWLFIGVILSTAAIEIEKLLK